MNDAGPVLRPTTGLKLSFRTPPMVDVGVAGRGVKRVLEADPPCATAGFKPAPGFTL
jgi:hypothetical protein